MDHSKAITLLRGTLAEISLPTGVAATEQFGGLREVDAKVRDVRHVIESVDGLPPSFLTQFDNDQDFQMQSRRVRLEALAGHIRSALKFLEAGGVTRPKKEIFAPPDVSKLTSSVPNLSDSIRRRWSKAHQCAHAECYTSAIIMMGSILEALLLARATLTSATAFQSGKAPRDRNGKSPALQDWTLSALIDVAVDVGWLKSDRGKFSHALRESRNVVHPWVEVTTRANFDDMTCKTSWEVLKASVDDLLKSLP